MWGGSCWLRLDRQQRRIKIAAVSGIVAAHPSAIAQGKLSRKAREIRSTPAGKNMNQEVKDLREALKCIVHYPNLTHNLGS